VLDKKTMSALVEKVAIYDSRVVSKTPVYGVQKGGLSVSSSPFNAISANASQHLFQINVPSQSVYVDRAVDWTADCYLKITATPAVVSAGDPVVVLGRDCALAPFPLTQQCSTISATINDSTVVSNVGDILNEMLRLTDYKPNRTMRTCPTYLDTYASYDDAYGTINNPLTGYGETTSTDEVKNGAWAQLYFTDPSGAVLAGNGSYVSGGVTVQYVAGIPVQTALVPAYPIFLKFRSTEKLMVSPFIWADAKEDDSVGLYGITNIQVLCNIQGPQRALRATSAGGVVISGLSYNTSVATSVGGSPFSGSRINVIFLTPPPQLPVPDVSSVSWMEYPRYISSQYSSLASGASTTLQSQNFVLPCIPDLLYIYARPASYDIDEADYHFPITNFSLNFDNFSGLMSSYTQQELYQQSVQNGLDMDYGLWSGRARLVNAGATGSSVVATVGGGLLIKPGKDFALSAEQAPGLLSNINIQFQVGVENTTASAATPVLYMITINSGFFESSKGQSRILRGILNGADVLSAPFMATNASVQRIVGGGIFSSLGNILSKAKDIYSATKPAISCIKEALPSGMAKDVLGKVGYGKTGGAMKKMSLSERLM
jgi:hypothetical protein